MKTYSERCFMYRLFFKAPPDEAEAGTGDYSNSEQYYDQNTGQNYDFNYDQSFLTDSQAMPETGWDAQPDHNYQWEADVDRVLNWEPEYKSSPIYDDTTHVLGQDAALQYDQALQYEQASQYDQMPEQATIPEPFAQPQQEYTSIFDTTSVQAPISVFDTAPAEAAEDRIIFCGQCGFQNIPQDKFCTNCGYKLAQGG